MAVLTEADINTRFDYHAPTDETRPKHEAINELTKAMATELNMIFQKPSREASLAFTALEELRMWANAAISRGG